MHMQKIQHDSVGEIFESGERRQEPRLEDSIQLRVRVMRYRASFIEFDTVTRPYLRRRNPGEIEGQSASCFPIHAN
jgi:hypothetical protein